MKKLFFILALSLIIFRFFLAPHLLFYFAENDKYSGCVDILLKTGIQPDIRKDIMFFKNQTPLMIACKYGAIKNAEILLKNGAGPNAEDGHKNSPLFYAYLAVDNAYNVVEKLMTLLLSSGADINHQNMNGSSLLISAASTNRYKIVEFLIKNGADPYIKNSRGDNALNDTIKFNKILRRSCIYNHSDYLKTIEILKKYMKETKQGESKK